MKSKRRTAKDYHDDLAVLRRYYTGFDKAHGFDLKSRNKKQVEAVKRVIRRFTPQLKQLKGIKTFPHLEVKGKSKRQAAALQRVVPVPGAALAYKARKTTGRGRKARSKIVMVTPQPKLVPVFTMDAKAKVGVNKDGSINIVENGHKRDVYAIDRELFSLDPYQYMRDFMRKHKAERVTLNVSGNVIGEVFSEWDFVDERERRLRELNGEAVRPQVGLFVTIVEKYREKDQARADSFISNIGAISVLRGGLRAANTFRNEVVEGRKKLVERRARLSKRARLTGRR